MEAHFYDSDNHQIAIVEINVRPDTFSKRSGAVQKKLDGLVKDYPTATLVTIERERYLIEDGVTRFNGFFDG